MMRRALLTIVTSVLLGVNPTQAESVDILGDSRAMQFSNPQSLEALNQRGNHFEVMTLARKQDKGLLSLSEQLAAARSAWALGLVDEARDYWTLALADEELTGAERYRTMLASAILELQEKNFDKAREISERATIESDASDVRSQFWLVIADSLKAQKALGAAQEYYARAVEEAADTRKAEARYLLAECQYLTGQKQKARTNFVLIETSSAYSSLALNRLAEIDLELENYKGVITWIEAGRRRASSEFRGAWQSYAYARALVAEGKLKEAEQEVDQLKARVSEQDPWYQLASVTLEGQLAQANLPVRAMLGRVSKETAEQTNE